MTEPKRRGTARPAKAPLIQDRPAEPPQRRSLDPGNRDGEFPPNPSPAKREGRPEAVLRHLRVIGPKEVGGVRAPGPVDLALTDLQLEALLLGGHVELRPGEAEPMAGTEKEGN